jgi:branched-chain amino acid transport system ATP-binding protein
MLRADGISKRFGGLDALTDVDLEVLEGEIVGLIGPNGAGKTTLLNILSGFIKADTGAVTFLGEAVTQRSPHARAQMGLRRTFQLESMFTELTVAENLALGAMHARGEARSVEDICGLVGLRGREHQAASLLTYGLRRRLAVGIALAGNPVLVLLDEPAAGLNGAEAQALAAVLEEVRARGTTVLLIDHNMDFVSGLVERVVVLDHGQVITAGPVAEVLADPTVVEVYLGRWA